ncbi:MAG: hypothetical protein LBH25_00965 [Fibromonadaceae bacterium]|jgi:predicted RND superfamily exporter protein|nr:hypothetical protein [Fibromonadaceae bacterium]
MKKPLCCILSFLLATPLFAQKAQSEEPISEAQAMLQESAQATQQNSEEASNEVSPQQRFEEAPKHNIHEYNYKQQVVVGGTVMFCIILAMVANNNYNPKGPKK